MRASTARNVACSTASGPSVSVAVWNGASIIEATRLAITACAAPVGCTPSAKTNVWFAFAATRFAGAQTSDGVVPAGGRRRVREAERRRIREDLGEQRADVDTQHVAAERVQPACTVLL